MGLLTDSRSPRSKKPKRPISNSATPRSSYSKDSFAGRTASNAGSWDSSPRTLPVNRPRSSDLTHRRVHRPAGGDVEQADPFPERAGAGGSRNEYLKASAFRPPR